MNYLTVLNTNGKYLLLLTTEGAINAQPTVEEAIHPFKSFLEKIVSPDYETHASSLIGVIQIHPHIIAWDKTAGELKPYVVDETVKMLLGGTVAGLRDCRFVEVSKDILKLSVKTILTEMVETLKKSK